MQTFGNKNGEAKYLIVVKKREIYCLNLVDFTKTIIDKLDEDKFTGMCTYSEDGYARIAVSVNFDRFMVYTYNPP